jgi:hypothetical protein
MTTLHTQRITLVFRGILSVALALSVGRLALCTVQQPAVQI